MKDIGRIHALIKLAPMKRVFESAPPLIIQKDEIDAALKILDECIAEEEKDMGL